MASRQKKLFYGSSYDRGLQHLLDMWDSIINKVPGATLDICYGWDLFEAAYANNPERMMWKEKMDELMSQKGIRHHGRVGKEKLAKIRRKCGVWAYPTHFTEINCITALDAQSDGLVPVVIELAALKETVGSGLKIKGDIYMMDTKKQFQEGLIKAMTNKDYWQEESKKAKEFAKSYKWENIASLWVKEFKK